jgi:hypothetical protein
MHQKNIITGKFSTPSIFIFKFHFSGLSDNKKNVVCKGEEFERKEKNSFISNFAVEHAEFIKKGGYFLNTYYNIIYIHFTSQDLNSK